MANSGTFRHMLHSSFFWKISSWCRICLQFLEHNGWTAKRLPLLLSTLSASSILIMCFVDVARVFVNVARHFLSFEKDSVTFSLDSPKKSCQVLAIARCSNSVHIIKFYSLVVWSLLHIMLKIKRDWKIT